MRFFRMANAMVFLLIAVFAFGAFFYTPRAIAGENIKIYINGQEIKTDTNPLIINDRTMVPIRVVSESLGMDVKWDVTSRSVLITSMSEKTTPADEKANYQSISILGESVVSSDELRRLALGKNPNAPDLADLYIKIGKEYGIRGDIAFCQAAKETGWWKYGGLVQPDQNNYCGLSATGSAATDNEDLRGADPSRVRFVEGRHGAFFDSPATGVEAHIQHLYAYASTDPLPAGKVLLSPRFALVNRGNSVNWEDLGGKWAVPGFDRNKYPDFISAFASCDTYGHSIINDYYKEVWQPEASLIVITPEQRIKDLEKENQALREQIALLKGLK